MLHDLRYAFRILAKNPGFAVVAVMVLGLGIGANTAVFSMVNALLLRPLAASGETPLIGVFNRNTQKPDSYRGFSYPNFQDIREHADLFSGLAARTFALVGLSEGSTTRRVFASVVSSNYFATLGVTPVHGRVFTADEERPGTSEPVVIVGYDFWTARGRRPDLVGKTIEINARPFTVVGIMPRGFTGALAIVGPEVWLPLGVYEVVVNDLFRATGTRLADRNHHTLNLVGRLKPGITMDEADARLSTIARQLEAAHPAENTAYTLQVHPLSRMGVSDKPISDTELLRTTSLLMLMSGLVLLIACFNLANMMLARATARRREVAVRMAIGGGRGRIVRQLFTEGLVLSGFGAVAGLLLSYWSTRLLTSSLTGMLPLTINFDAAPDVRVIGAAALFAVVSTVAFALVPAWKLSRRNILTDLKDQSDGSTLRNHRFGLRNMLVVGQLALSLALLTAGGLFTRAAMIAATADPGFSLDNGIVVGLDPSLASHSETRGRQTYDAVLQRVRSLAGVETASLAALVPFGEFTDTQRVQRPRPKSTSGDAPSNGVIANYNIVGTGYFRTLGLPILRGRDFTPQEERANAGVRTAIIGAPLVSRLFGDEDPIGQTVEIPANENGTPATQLQVVGIVPGMRHQLFDREPTPHIYVPFGQQYRGNMNLHVRVASVRGAGATDAMLATLRRELRTIDARLPVISLKTLTMQRDSSLELWIVRLGGTLFAVFGAIALVLASVGVYGVRAYLVARRTREIGIRMALGAAPRDVLRMMLREGVAVTATGLCTGVLIAAGIGRLLSNMLFEVRALDPLVFTAAFGTLAAAAFLATYVPARGATRVVPIVALRSD